MIDRAVAPTVSSSYYRFFNLYKQAIELASRNNLALGWLLPFGYLAQLCTIARGNRPCLSLAVNAPESQAYITHGSQGLVGLRATLLTRVETSQHR